MLLLPDLPNVRILICNINRLTSLPALPDVTYLNCSINNLTRLPSVTTLQASENTDLEYDIETAQRFNLPID